LLTFFEGSRKDVLNTFGTLVLVSNYGFQVWQISLLLMASSIVNMISAPYMGWLIDHLGERKCLSTSYVLLTLCCVGFAVLHNPWVLVGVLIVMKLAVMLGMGLNTYVYRLAPAEELTPTLSAGISINHISSVAMPIVAGILLPIIHYEGIFWGTAGLIFLSVPLALALQVPTAAVQQLEPVAAK
jgi:MFS family permease